MRNMDCVIRSERKDEFVQMMLGMLEHVGACHREMKECCLPFMHEKACYAATRKYMRAINHLINVAQVFKRVWSYEVERNARVLDEINMHFNIVEFFEFVER